MRGELLSDLDREITVRYRTINAFLIVRQGYLVFERYFSGCGPDDKHLVASVTKSFISALIGIAIDQGLYRRRPPKRPGLFPRIYAWSTRPPEAADDHQAPADNDSRIPVAYWLAITRAVYRQACGAVRTGWRSSWICRFESDRLTPFNTTAPILICFQPSSPAAQEGAPGNSLLNTCLTLLELTNPLPTCRHTYSQADVFRNTAGGWPRDPQGNSIGGWGLLLKPRDMARFGYLVSQRRSLGWRTDHPQAMG